MSSVFPPAKRNRRERIRKLELVIKENGENVQKAIANFCLYNGVSLRTVREYLKFLKLAGKIDEDVSI